jgi:quinol monooxygenase YgiN
VLGIVATLKTKPGQDVAFEELAKTLVAAVHANEPGCLLYTLFKAEEPNTYVFLERYQDEAALQAHRSTAYFKDIGRKMGEHMDGRAQILRLREI